MLAPPVQKTWVRSDGQPSPACRPPLTHPVAASERSGVLPTPRPRRDCGTTITSQREAERDLHGAGVRPISPRGL